MVFQYRNGLVDPGEDCDAGVNGVPTSSNCCTADCKFKPSAVCDASNGFCCTSDCQFASSSVSCRAASSKDPIAGCDKEDFCSGTSAQCTNTFSPNGTTCSYLTSNPQILQATSKLGRCSQAIGADFAICQSRQAACAAQSTNTTTYSYKSTADVSLSCTLVCVADNSIVPVSFHSGSGVTVNTPDW